MTPERIEKLLALLNSQVDESAHRTGWVIATCPFAPWTHGAGLDRNPSFGVRYKGGGTKQMYNCFSCGEAGDLDDMVFDVRDKMRETGKKDARYLIGKALSLMVAEDDEVGDFEVPDYEEPADDPAETIVWPELYVESFKSVFMHADGMDYLKTRQINEKVIKELDLRYDTSRQRVCFPIRDWDGKLVGLHGRHIADHPLRYFAYGYEGRRNRMPWYGEHWLDFDRTVVLVESVFDLASVRRVYDNVACPLSCGFSNDKVKRIDGAIDYVTIFDKGKGGDTARDRLDKVLQSPAEHYLPSNDKGDAGDMTKGEVEKLLDIVLQNS